MLTTTTTTTTNSNNNRIIIINISSSSSLIRNRNNLRHKNTTTTNNNNRVYHKQQQYNYRLTRKNERSSSGRGLSLSMSSSSPNTDNINKIEKEEEEEVIINNKGKILEWSDIDQTTKILPTNSVAKKIQITGVHHVAIIVKDMKRTMEFYQGILGLAINPARPKDKLPYDGAWLWIGDEMIHIMELENPDPDDLKMRPEHGGRDRHFCIGCENIQPLMDALDENNVPYTKSKSGRPAIFFRDPDSNTLEVVEGLEWRL
jgi:glyoxylase I family protein